MHHLWCRDKILTRVENLREAKIALELVPMVPADSSLNTSFWREVVNTAQDEAAAETGAVPDLQSHLGVREPFNTGLIFKITLK
jgi:hypothetical protein